MLKKQLKFINAFVPKEKEIVGAGKDILYDNKLNPGKISIRIASIYIIVGIMWILLSDRLLGLAANNKDTFKQISMIKGWLYVFVTGLLIYFLIHSALNRIKTAESSLYVSYQELSKANTQLAAAYDKVDESQQKLMFQAYHDQLTGLLNRRALMNRLEKLVETKKHEKIALLIVDIDNFKYINDTMGHSFGDNLLVLMSERLVELVGERCGIYRLSGDEFVILIEGFEEGEEVEKLAVGLLRSCEERFDINSSSMFTTISVGISLYPEHGEDLEEILKNADIAVYKAKQTGRNRIVFYNKPMNDALAERVQLEKHLRTALNNNEFVLHYQPQLDIATNKVSGFEALLRWQSPELGTISPLKFISIAEDTHLIIPIGQWVIRSACQFLKRLHLQGHEHINMSVNVSMLQLLQEDFVDKLMSILEEVEMNPMYLELEITESVLMESYETIADKLKLLQGKGIKIALDDFGKGYSSLNYLKQLPISTLKIDKSFIDTIISVEKDKSLADLIVKIGRTMGMCVVAEGVETMEQLDYLKKHKCSKIQGYLFSRPIPEELVIETVNKKLGFYSAS